MSLRGLVIGVSLFAVVGSAAAVDLKGLKKKLGGEQPAAASADAGTATDAAGASGLLGALGGNLALPGISGDTAGNAAGVLEYCVKNKYLDGNAAATVKDKLLSKFGMQNEQEAQQDEGYQSGLQGLLQGGDGKSLNLDSISGKVKDKACDYVLDNASSLI